MRLLQWRNGTVTFTKYLLDNIPPYAILSHTWGEDDDEVTFRDIATGTADQKPAYQKILFCGKQASHDGLEYFWVDSCCIDRSGGSELQEAITSMFRWYQNASKCYVYLSDVVSDDERQPSQDELRRANWKVSFRNSRWFTRGWTLQELLAPQSVEFFSKDASKLGNKTNLSQLLQDITGIPIIAFEGTELSSFSDGDKMSWAKDRNTKRKEDKAYCLLGIFGISMRISYGEGEEHAMRRLRKKIEKPLKILLESLDYNHPFTRVNNISEPSDGTFAWILDPQCSNPLDPSMGFLQWLENEGQVFCITGLPGSGKSTLMKSLAGSQNKNQRVLQKLKLWAAPGDPRILSFYFWRADSANLQNTFRGFLCSLLYQLLCNTSWEIATRLVPLDWLQKKHRTDDWDPRELERLLMKAVAQIATVSPLCFFIDGLDECVESDREDVLRVIRDLVIVDDHHLKIKFCVSVRPDWKIQQQLGSAVVRSLQLHTVTTNDIRKYVTDQFKQCGGDTPASPTNAQKNGLIESVVSSSNGVFLWAVLVAKELRKGIDIGDTIRQLQAQLQALPKDMMELYKDLLKRSGVLEGRQAEAAAYIKFTISCNSWTLSHLGPTIASYCTAPGLYAFVPLYEHFHGKLYVQNEKKLLRIVGKRIQSLSAGFLTVNDSEGVNFFHQTALDFFREAAASFLEQSKLSQLDIFRLRIDSIFRNGHTGCSARLGIHEIRVILQWCRQRRDMCDAEKVRLLQHIDRAMRHYCAVKYRGTKRNWVYEQAQALSMEMVISNSSEYKVLDFASLACTCGLTELISHHLDKGRKLSRRYKDYLLLCWASNEFPDRAWRQKLLTLGADPNAVFYWGLQNRVKTSPWLEYLVNILSSDRKQDNGKTNTQTDTVESFLNNRANLDDRTVLLIYLDNALEWRNKVEFRAFFNDLKGQFAHDELAVVEVNAKCILEEYFEKFRLSIGREKVLSRHDVRRVESYRRVLLLHPGNQKRLNPKPEERSQRPPFAEISFHDSEKLWNSRLIFPRPKSIMTKPGSNARQAIGNPINHGRLRFLKLKEFDRIWKRSPKLRDLEQYLEEKGYYCRGIPQGPIPMFEDEECVRRLN